MDNTKLIILPFQQFEWGTEEIEVLIPGIIHSVIFGNDDEFQGDLLEVFAVDINREDIGEVAAIDAYYARMCNSVGEYLRRTSGAELLRFGNGYDVVEANIVSNTTLLLELSDVNLKSYI